MFVFCFCFFGVVGVYGDDFWFGLLEVYGDGDGVDILVDGEGWCCCGDVGGGGRNCCIGFLFCWCL